MVHHFCFMRPIRSLIGLILLAGAILFFYGAVQHVDYAPSSSRSLAMRFEPPLVSTEDVTISAPAEIAPDKPDHIPTPPRPISDGAAVRPDWVGRPPHLETQGKLEVYLNQKHVNRWDNPTHLATQDGLEVYVATATAGPYLTLAECDRALGAEIDRVVADFAEAEFQPAVDRPVKLDRDEIQDHLIEDRYTETVNSSVGPMQQEHALLVFDSHVRAAIEQGRRAIMVDERLKYAAAGSGTLFLALGGVYLLLRRKPAAARSS